MPIRPGRFCLPMRQRRPDPNSLVTQWTATLFALVLPTVWIQTDSPPSLWRAECIVLKRKTQRVKARARRIPCVG
jgi:hypothetical protein